MPDRTKTFLKCVVHQVLEESLDGVLNMEITVERFEELLKTEVQKVNAFTKHQVSSSPSRVAVNTIMNWRINACSSVRTFHPEVLRHLI